MKFIFIFFLQLNLFICAQASPVLYEAEVNCSSKKEESAALNRALQQVINHLTPDENDDDNPIIRAADPKQFLKSFSCERNILHAKFYPEKINQLMNKAGQQPWLDNRPKVFVWVSQVLKGGVGIAFRYPKQFPAVFESLENAAKAKGLELIFPSPYEFRPKSQLNKDKPVVVGLAEMARDYKPEAILYVDLSYESKGSVYERWQVYYQGHTCFSPDQKKLPINDLGEYAIIGSSKCFFEHGEQKIITPHSIYVNVSNIQSVKGYNQVMDYITHIPGIIHTSVHSVTADAVLYKLEMRIPVSLLEMRLAQKFTPLPPLSEEGIINYRLSS